MDYQKQYEQTTLNTKSRNHQLAAYRGKYTKRYIKSIISSVSALRLDLPLYKRTGEQSITEVLLWSTLPATAIRIIESDKDHIEYIYSDIPVRYSDEVLELYGDEDIDFFEALNKVSIDTGILIEYDADKEYVWSVVGHTGAAGKSFPQYRLTEADKPLNIVRQRAIVG